MQNYTFCFFVEEDKGITLFKEGIGCSADITEPITVEDLAEQFGNSVLHVVGHVDFAFKLGGFVLLRIDTNTMAVLKCVKVVSEYTDGGESHDLTVRYVQDYERLPNGLSAIVASVNEAQYPETVLDTYGRTHRKPKFGTLGFERSKVTSCSCCGKPLRWIRPTDRLPVPRPLCSNECFDNTDTSNER